MQLQSRLVAHLRDRIRKGELTERGLARVSGVSQPHIHNILKGKRIMSMALSDQVLRTLRIDLLDLLAAKDIERLGPDA